MPSMLAGAAWSALNVAASVVLPLGLFVVFARVLSPTDIAVAALATAMAEFGKTLGLSGTYEALLQERDDHPEERRKAHATAAFMMAGSGALLFLVYLGIATAVAARTGQDWQHFLATCLIGLRIPLDLAGSQPQAALAQRLAYQRLALRTVWASLLAGALAMGLVFAGTPFAGLVANQLGQSVLLLGFTVVGTGAAVLPRLHRDYLARMWREAAYSTSVRTVAAVNNQLDQVLVGALVGTLALAYYSLSKRIEVTFMIAAGSFGSIVFQPAFARGVREGVGLGAAASQAFAITTATSGLVAAFLLVNTAETVALVFGPQWLPAVPIVVCAAASGFLRALGGVPSAMLSVSGRNRQFLQLAAAGAVAGVLLILGGATSGVVWCAAALVLRNAVSTAIALRLIQPLIAGSWLTTLAGILVPFAAMLAGAAAGREAGFLLLPLGSGGHALAAFLRLALSGTCAAALGAGAILLRHREAVTPLLRRVALRRRA